MWVIKKLFLSQLEIRPQSLELMLFSKGFFLKVLLWCITFAIFLKMFFLLNITEKFTKTRLAIHHPNLVKVECGVADAINQAGR